MKKQLSMDEKKAFEDYESPAEDSELSDAQKAERANIKGVWFEEDYLRSYPFNELANDAIGFTLSRDTADVGLESYYNSTLMGTDGRQYGYINDNADVEQTIIDPKDGQSIVTTLDVGVQQIVEKYVNGFKEAMGAKNIGVIAMKPSTGEIIAMDGGDRYDLNDPRDLSSKCSEEEIAAMSDEDTVAALNAMWSNFCVTETYEPGSVVKPIVMAGESMAEKEFDQLTPEEKKARFQKQILLSVMVDRRLVRMVIRISSVRYGRMRMVQRHCGMLLQIPVMMR